MAQYEEMLFQCIFKEYFFSEQEADLGEGNEKFNRVLVSVRRLFWEVQKHSDNNEMLPLMVKHNLIVLLTCLFEECEVENSASLFRVVELKWRRQIRVVDDLLHYLFTYDGEEEEKNMDGLFFHRLFQFGEKYACNRAVENFVKNVINSYLELMNRCLLHPGNNAKQQFELILKFISTPNSAAVRNHLFRAFVSIREIHKLENHHHLGQAMLLILDNEKEMKLDEEYFNAFLLQFGKTLQIESEAKHLELLLVRSRFWENYEACLKQSNFNRVSNFTATNFFFHGGGVAIGEDIAMVLRKEKKMQRLYDWFASVVLKSECNPLRWALFQFLLNVKTTAGQFKLYYLETFEARQWKNVDQFYLAFAELLVQLKTCFFIPHNTSNGALGLYLKTIDFLFGLCENYYSGGSNIILDEVAFRSKLRDSFHVLHQLTNKFDLPVFLGLDFDYFSNRI